MKITAIMLIRNEENIIGVSVAELGLRIGLIGISDDSAASRLVSK